MSFLYVLVLVHILFTFIINKYALHPSKILTYLNSHKTIAMHHKSVQLIVTLFEFEDFAQYTV